MKVSVIFIMISAAFLFSCNRESQDRILSTQEDLYIPQPTIQIQEEALTVSIDDVSIFSNSQEFIPIWEMTDITIFRIYEIELKDFVGIYRIGRVLNGIFNPERFRIESVDDFYIQIESNIGTGEFYFFTNLPGVMQGQMDASSIFRNTTLLAANGPFGFLLVNMHFTSKGILLSFQSVSFDEWYYESIVQMKKITSGTVFE